MSSKAILALVVPGACALAAAAVTLLAAGDAAWAAQASRGYPVLVLLVVGMLALRFRRSRVAAAALALLLAHAALHPVYELASPAATALAVALLPLLLLSIALLDDAGAATPHGAVQLASPMVVGLLAAAGVALVPDRIEALVLTPIIDPWYTQAVPLPQRAAFVGGLGTLGLFALAGLRRKPVEAGLAWAGLAGALALASPGSSTAHGVWLLAAGLALAIALVEVSHQMAYRDELTGLPARRALQDTLASLRGSYAVAVVDVDRFKQFNDRYGHDVGDQVLRMVAAKLARVGGGGKAFRSGGEEFTLLFAGLGKQEALPFVEEVRESIASNDFTVRKQPRPKGKDAAARRGKTTTPRTRHRVTVSIGVAEVDGRNASVEAVVRSADEAMYRAKKGGRNRVAV